MTHPAAAESPASLVARICEAAEIEPPAITLGSRKFLFALTEEDRVVDGLRFLAHLLPAREVVWWAWMCAREEISDEAAEPEIVALQATERWIAEPTDEHRRAAMDAAEAATFETPAGCAALAAFLSGGSLAPIGAAEVPPPPFAAAKAAFGSLVFSAVAHDPVQAPDRYRRFFEYGMELAERTHLWQNLQEDE